MIPRTLPRAALGALLLIAAGLHANHLERISVTPLRTDANGDSLPSDVSADGRYIVYGSWAENLVAPDTNGHQDVFVYDRVRGVTERVSVAADGTQADADCSGGQISADGRYVAFVSAATTLLPDANGHLQIYLKDRETGTVTRLSQDDTGAPLPAASSIAAITPDARYVLFNTTADTLVEGDTNAAQSDGYDGFLLDRDTGAVERITLGPGGVQSDRNSFAGDLSDDGRYIVFRSDSTTFGNGADGTIGQIYLLDRDTGAVTHVSVATDGSLADRFSAWDHISGDGSTITFGSQATNLVPNDTNGAPDQPFDSNGTDVFIVSREQAGTPGALRRLSLAEGGEQGNRGSYEPEISADGRFVTFFSEATNIITPDANGAQADILLADTLKGTVERLNHAADGTQSRIQSSHPMISGNGRIIAFWSEADNLVPGDRNRVPGDFNRRGSDVFVVHRLQPPPAGAITDSDGDGLDDDWETLHFGDLRFVAADDPDGDGRDNATEHSEGTLPFGYEVAMKRGWNQLSLPHTPPRRAISEWFPGTSAVGWQFHADDRAGRQQPALFLAADTGTWVWLPKNTKPTSYQLPLP